MIQVINYSGTGKINNKDIKYSKINCPQSLDEYEFNLIDLCNGSIWCNKNGTTSEINIINDFKSLNIMIGKSKKATNILIIPQNYEFKYSYSHASRNYVNEIQLKDILPNLQNILAEIHSKFKSVKLIYENTSTKLGQSYLNASFYFDNDYNALTYSVGSNKPTTVDYRQNYNIILTTLNIETYEEIIDFLRSTKLIKDKEEIPEWLKNYIMFDDEKQIDDINRNIEIIRISKENIANAQKIIDQNNEYKSILYTNGDELVRVVFKILEEMLQCNLSSFEDIKREDFSVEINGKHLVGEIKGVTPNVKSENITQLDVHYQNYIELNNLTEQNVKSVLIINHQRSKPLENREPVHDTQIKIAERNGSLIIETIILLKLFEKYKNNQINSEECMELLFNNTGILKEVNI